MKQNGQFMAEEDKFMSDYERLFQFIPWLQEDDAGEWVFDKENDGSPEHPKHAPYFRYSNTVNRFLDALFAETKKLSEDGPFPCYEIVMESGLSWHEADLEETDVSHLPAKTILAMISVIVAGERFSDGAIARFIGNGCIVRWLERLKEIDEQNSSFSPDADLPETVDLVMELSDRLSQEVAAFFLECRTKNQAELNDYLFDRFVVWHRRIYEIDLSSVWEYLDTCSEDDYERVHPTVVAMERVVDHLHNPLLLGLHSLPEIVYIICHEIEHIVLNHPAEAIRQNQEKDPAIASKLNIAMDASINDRLSFETREYGLRVLAEPADCVTSTFLVKFFNLHFKELQAYDYYFEHIPDMGGMGSCKSLIIVVVAGDGKQIITQKKRKGMVPAHIWTKSGNADDVESLIRKFVSDVYDAMPENTRANLPAHQKETIERMIAPPAMSWKRILKKYIGTIPDGHRKTRTRLSRRQPERYDVSGTISSRLIKLVVAIDTSGSVSREKLAAVFSEIFEIVGTRLCETTVIECDSEIQRIYKAKSAKDVSLEVSGRGGTSFCPVIDYVNRNRYFRDAVLIYFTDGEGDRSIPKPLTYKTVWVLHDETCKLSVRHPYGEVVAIDQLPQKG